MPGSQKLSFQSAGLSALGYNFEIKIVILKRIFSVLNHILFILVSKTRGYTEFFDVLLVLECIFGVLNRVLLILERETRGTLSFR